MRHVRHAELDEIYHPQGAKLVFVYRGENVVVQTKARFV